MENQPTQPQKAGNKALWIVLIIVILAVAGYGVYAYLSDNDNENTNNANTVVNTVTNTNSALNTNTTANANIPTNTNIDTTGWKTYENTELGFGINYPSDWYVGTRKATNTASALVYLASDSNYIDFYINGKTTIKVPQEGFKIKLFTDNGLGGDPNPEIALKTENGRDALPLVHEEFLTINSLRAYRAIRQIKQGEVAISGQILGITRTDVEYTFLNNKNLYRVWLEVDSNNPDQLISEFDKVANTLQLL